MFLIFFFSCGYSNWFLALKCYLIFIFFYFSWERDFVSRAHTHNFHCGFYSKSYFCINFIYGFLHILLMFLILDIEIALLWILLFKFYSFFVSFHGIFIFIVLFFALNLVFLIDCYYLFT